MELQCTLTASFQTFFKKKERKNKETPVIKETSSTAEEWGLGGMRHLSGQEPAARRMGDLSLGLKTGTGLISGRVHTEFFSDKVRANSLSHSNSFELL